MGVCVTDMMCFRRVFGQIHTGQLPSRTSLHQENSLPRQFPTRTIPYWDNSPPRKLPTRTIANQDNSSLGHSPPGNPQPTLSEHVLVVSLPSGGIVLVKSCPSGELSWWGVALVGNCPSGEFSWWRLVLVGSCPRG